MYKMFLMYIEYLLKDITRKILPKKNSFMGISNYSLVCFNSEQLKLPSNLSASDLLPNTDAALEDYDFENNNHRIKIPGCIIDYGQDRWGIMVRFDEKVISIKQSTIILKNLRANVSKIVEQQLEIIHPVDIVITVDDAGDESVLARDNGDGTYILLELPLNQQYRLGEIVKPTRSKYGMRWLGLPQVNPNYKYPND